MTINSLPPVNQTPPVQPSAHPPKVQSNTNAPSVSRPEVTGQVKNSQQNVQATPGQRPAGVETNVAQGVSQPPSSSSSVNSSIKSFTEEALETAAETKTEAAKGDQQAIRILAKKEAANNSKSAAQSPTQANGIGDIVDRFA